MRLTTAKFDVSTRFGGRFVQSIDGLKGQGAGGSRDWFFFVNGVESEVGAAEYELSLGRPRPVGLPRLGHRDARAGDRRRLPGPVPDRTRRQAPPGAASSATTPGRSRASDAKDALERVDVPVSSSSLGAPGTEQVTRLVVARWPRARIVRGAFTLEEGPESSGVFARFSKDGRSLDLLDERGDVARTVRAGDGTGLVVALRPRADELVWLVTALDSKGLAAGVRALREDELRDAFAVAATGRTVEKLPLESP